MRRMKFLFLLLAAALLNAGKTTAQTFSGKRTLYIIRHAEKDTVGGNNPAISIIGKERAGDLYRVLKKKKIDLIFVNQYKRTAMTADSIRIYKNIDTIMYVPDLTGDKLFERINAKAGKAKNILIVGHSNTLPGILRKAGISSFVEKELPDNEYDNLFIVTQKKGNATMKSKKYGKLSK